MALRYVAPQGLSLRQAADGVSPGLGVGGGCLVAMGASPPARAWPLPWPPGLGAYRLGAERAGPAWLGGSNPPAGLRGPCHKSFYDPTPPVWNVRSSNWSQN